MIDASIDAVPHLWPVFLALAVPFAAVAWPVGRRKNRSTLAAVGFAVSVAGVLAVTLAPGQIGDAWQSGLCEAGLPLGSMFSDASTQLNVLLFVPPTLLAVPLFRRPAVSFAVAATSTALIELIQTTADLGRACSYADLAANVLGAALGTLGGVAWTRARTRAWPFSARDAVWGGAIAVCAGLALTWTFHSGTTTSHHDAARRTTDGILAEDQQARDEWFGDVIRRLYGRNTDGQVGTQILADGHLRLTAETDKGTITALWPDRVVTQAWSTDNKDDHGALTPGRMKKAGERFARSWFGTHIKGARETFGPIDSKGGAYHLGYRRYRDGVMMPLRLDLTVTTSGRIIGFTADTTADPRLPTVRVPSGDALTTARKLSSEGKARVVQLLAQRVEGAWRPVWMTDIGSEEPVFLDAVTGKQVRPQRGD